MNINLKGVKEMLVKSSYITAEDLAAAEKAAKSSSLSEIDYLLNKNIITKDLPVIILSAKADEANLKNSLETLRANDYLIKTDYSLKEIVEKIKKYI